MGIEGTGLKAKNPQLRVLLLVFGGIIAMASVLYWRTKTIENAEYVDYSTGKHTSLIKEELHSKNYQVQVQDASPSAR